MVPPFDKTQHSGVGAALEFPVTALNVENILVIGHSRCGGIKGLMSIEDDAAPAKNLFIDNWVQIGTPAKEMIKQDFKHLSFNDQYSYCEKEAVNVSLGNLLSYPFVKERVMKNKLAIRGAHYDFVKGTFDLWELDLKTTPAFSFS
ncbi:Beta carbonic anhydrase 3 [Raphanus sativus]|uniref:Carbonic anhydrase n=1 Tax=Raphanus sativus TaxID=3726 RepID=A0A6J0M5Z0_RAPSA|nr:beta carbonic anhydrase 3-like [Raphanus sativus]KAJ4916504.1 Beta carbonic anhydrase 3 [Raphanus sativus]